MKRAQNKKRNHESKIETNRMGAVCGVGKLFYMIELGNNSMRGCYRHVYVAMEKLLIMFAINGRHNIGTDA